jgi:hypothetical protein
MPKKCVLICVACLCIMMADVSVNAQEFSGKTQRVAIRAARLIDGKSDTVLKNGVVLIEGEKITAVDPR